MELKDQDFIKTLRHHGEVYQVGGFVRDKFLNKKSKDLDLLVTGLSLNEIKYLISGFGKVSIVGESYQVVKFTQKDLGEIDIAIPRSERLMTQKEKEKYKIRHGKYPNIHQSFITLGDPFLPIVKDLERRDFTINSIAIDMDGNIIDPFNGLADLNSGVIRMTNPKSFIDDPLRMLRAVQFASRFNFDIEKETLQFIIDHSESIDLISKERVLEEIDKIFHKGNIIKGLEILNETNLYKSIFNVECLDLSMFKCYSSLITLRSEFYHLLLNCDISEILFKNLLCGDNITYKEIKAINFLFKLQDEICKFKIRKNIINACKISDVVLSSKLLNEICKKEIEFIKNNNLPIFIKDIKIDGNDLIKLGFNGKELGNLLNLLHELILEEKLENDTNKITLFVKNLKKS